jgi:hypothetical protein
MHNGWNSKRNWFPIICLENGSVSMLILHLRKLMCTCQIHKWMTKIKGCIDVYGREQDGDGGCSWGHLLPFTASSLILWALTPAQLCLGESSNFCFSKLDCLHYCLLRLHILLIWPGLRPFKFCLFSLFPGCSLGPESQPSNLVIFCWLLECSTVWLWIFSITLSTDLAWKFLWEFLLESSF